jgi:YjbE family integral membrane protein
MCQVIFIDLVLAGDNAIVVGMVAAGVALEHRRRVILGGIAMAVFLRIFFAALTMQLLGIIGLTLAGGLLLLWVCWKLYRELREQAEEETGVMALEDGDEETDGVPRKSMRQAIGQIAIADLSMSLDNVLAVAGAAADHPRAMVFGLALSVVLMGVGATFIAQLLQRHQWIAYLGLAVIGYVAVSMIWRGGFEIARVAGI